ncbi:TPA: hypothetical protein SLZ51_002326 [Vibrio cholerae]|uniref:hypothetical protein n=1 Tax=Vibrio cholerae TaxID=666 RepID=UPI000BA9535B|nr:hypothetical protein [Vibrio cholerae]EHU8077628.1 hypothetical protein [Vibrio cholerae]EHV9953684.1 hypothetical protein [Vibrio cholerae]MEB5557030.1 hypothetical protein [Vibrio cholerae]PAS33429.1 hypothetical protein CGT72_10210 [Vibrio cholerae]HCJ7273389.1 hypothetical protein [Vibrio cholerae]
MSASQQSLVDAAFALIKSKSEQGQPEICKKCKGLGTVKGLFATNWDCVHCDGLGYAGDPLVIAKWFKGALIQRTETLQTIGNHCKDLTKEIDVLKAIYPDWEQRRKEHFEQESHEKFRSRFD